MSGQENNYKYIAEAWLNDEKEYEFKRAFLESLIKQYQGHNNGFDADKLDGMHYVDILEEISLATTDMMTSFYIGDTHFKQNPTAGERYHLDVRAIKLYPEAEHIDEGTFINESEYPWNYTADYYTNKTTSRVRLGGDPNNENNWPNPTLFDIIREAYYLLQKNKVNVSTFNNLKDRVTDLEENVGTMENHNFNGKLNADTVNGLQFYVVTQEQYENDYSLEEKNDIHNVFIIKESIPTGTYDGNPSFPSFLNEGYEFAVQLMNIPSPDDPNISQEELCLVYRIKSEGNQNEWKIIAPASDFIDRDYLANIIQDTSFQLSAEVMGQAYLLPVKIYSLRDYQKDNNKAQNDDAYTIPAYVKRNYLYGARVHTLEHVAPSNSNSSGTFNVVKTEGATDYTYLGSDGTNTDDIKKKNGYLYLNLDSVIKNIKDVVHARFGVVDGYINSLRTSLNGVTGRVETLESGQSTHTSQINSINASIAAHTSSLDNKINKGQWLTYYLDGVNIWTKQYRKEGTSKSVTASSFPLESSKIIYNLELGIAYIELHLVHRTTGYFQGYWRGLSIPKSYMKGDDPIRVEQGDSYTKPNGTRNEEVPRGVGMWDIYSTYEWKQNLAYQRRFSDFDETKIPQNIFYPVTLPYEPKVYDQDYNNLSPYIPSNLLPEQDITLSPIGCVNTDKEWARVRITSSIRKVHFNNDDADEILNTKLKSVNEGDDYYLRHQAGEILIWYMPNPPLSTNWKEEYRSRDIIIHASGVYKLKGS